jgi:hypothetical protein
MALIEAHLLGAFLTDPYNFKKIDKILKCPYPEDHVVGIKSHDVRHLGDELEGGLAQRGEEGDVAALERPRRAVLPHRRENKKRGSEDVERR